MAVGPTRLLPTEMETGLIGGVGDDSEGMNLASPRQCAVICAARSVPTLASIAWTAAL